MRKKMAVAAVLSSGTTAVMMHLLQAQTQADPARRVLLENARVRVAEVTYAPGAPRPRGVRANDQVIVFLDDCRYERIDPETGRKEVRVRKSGDVIWHDKGEAAPVLTNVGERAYRTVVVEVR